MSGLARAAVTARDIEPAPRTGDDTRSALLDAAIQAFSHATFDSVSVRDIERRAGVNRGLVAYHFGTKADLWKHAIDSLMTDFHDVMSRYGELFSLVSPGERDRILLKVYVRFVAERPEFFRILVLEGNDPSDRTRWLNERYLRRLVDFFHRHTGIEDTRDPVEAAIDHFVFTGAASMVFAAGEQARQLFGVDPTDPEFMDRFADLIADLGYVRSARTAPDSQEDPA